MSQPYSIDYIEFSTSDLAASKAFFSQVFGWEFKDYGDTYASFKDVHLRGGFSRSDTAAQGGPLVVLYAADLGPVQDKVTAHGGAVTVETFEFPGGRRFHFREPGGNELAVWSE